MPSAFSWPVLVPYAPSVLRRRLLWVGLTKDVMRTATIIATLFCLSASSAGATEQSSKELASLGLTTWSAFECTSWASVMKDEKQTELLFELGLSSGRQFIESVRAGKVTREDISAEVPIGLVMLLQGPSTDFILGRIFESVQEYALKEVVKSKDGVNEKPVQAVIASNMFRAANCSLLRGR